MIIDNEQLKKTQKLQKLMRDPVAVLALIAENERLKAGVDSDMAEIDRIQAEYDKQFRRAREFRIERDHLKAANAGLKTGYEAYEQVVQGLKAENEALRNALKAAEVAMWKAESNMDNEAADIRDLLAAMSKGAQS
ncbi:hypothetical protein AB4P95_05495 [Pseudomonas sp. A1437]|uniref:hypothetical protein n=1 Tax=unclassified Pseudomonas TaxID=196821 RepID=UPI003784F138